MDDIAAWLEEIGLGQHVELLRANDVTAAVLPELTDQDLRELGLSLGHRRLLLRAIKSLARSSDDAGVAVAPTPARRAGVVRPEPERRQLTVMFCDLVGSTDLAARLDPEDMRAVIGAYQSACSEVIRRYEGHVAKYMGDGVLAYFGYPRAHEDDAERAVRAGLELAQAVGRQTANGAGLAARIGIATGLVVVGDLIGEGTVQEVAVVGETPNLAARLQAMAAPGTVVISQATRRLVGGLFELLDLGPQPLKGFRTPVRAFQVESEGRAEGRFEALHGERLTPLVGREHELGILLERWAWAKDGEGQVVLLAGEPGIGKSRLIRALRERLGDEPYTPLSLYCSPYHANSAFHPVIGLLERAAGLDRNEPPEVQLAGLEAVLGRASARLDEVMPLLGALLGVATGPRYPALTLTPEVQKRRTMQALLDHLAGLAAQQPVLALYDDVHWIDPSSLELLGLVIERIQQLPVLVLVTFRPEFQPPWIGQAHVTTLTLSRLGRRQGADLVARVTENKPLPAAIVEQIVARTDGVPLFVEELTKAVLESGLLADAGDHFEQSGPLPPLAIPATLHDALMARLDRLAPVKEVAQISAVIGREFSHELVAAVAGRPEDELQAALDQLVSSELVFRGGSPPATTYTFKHALVQDAAYHSLLKSKRQQVHALIAQVLERGFAQTTQAQPELLAYHCTQAGLSEKAVHYWYKAGRQSMARSAMTEAVAQLSNGLILLADLPADPDRDGTELDLQVALGGALVSIKGYAAAEVGRAYARARELCVSDAQVPQLLAALSGLFVHHMHATSLPVALDIAREMLSLAERGRDTAAQAVAHRSLGAGLTFHGDLAPALTHFDQGVRLYESADRASPVFLAGSNVRVACLNFAPLVILWQGCPDQALARSQEAFAAAQELRHAFTLSHVLHLNCWLHQIIRNPQLVLERAAQQIASAGQHGLPVWLSSGHFFHGWAVAMTGDIEAGTAEIRQALAIVRGAGTHRLQVAHYLGSLAHIHAQAGNSPGAIRLISEALALVEEVDERWFEAELHRLKGEVLLTLPAKRTADAECCFHKSLGIAQQQKAKLWELRAAVSLARLWAEHGERQNAADLLAPVYGWFTEGFDTADLKDAKALLDAIA